MMYRTGERNIVARQGELLAVQTQLSSGKRINSPSDDPIGAAEIAGLRSAVSQFQQYKDNQDHGRYLLNLGEAALEELTLAMQDVKEKLVAAGNGAYGNSERQMIAQDLEGILGRIVGLANSSDGSGGYLFSGARANVAPFAQTGTTVTFHGDEVLQKLEVSKDRFQQVKISGDALFLKMRPGNGTFTTAAAAGNAGSGTIDVGTVVAPAQLTGSAYRIDFAVTGGVTTFQVVRASDSAVVSSGTYQAPATIEFDGMRVVLQGVPADGDRFDVAPAPYRSVFETLAAAIATLRQPVTDEASRARFDTALAGVMASIDQALDHFSLKRADIGTALAELDAYERLNDDRMLQHQTRQSGIESLDYAAAATELAARQASFDAAIKSYSVVSRLSLFDYL